MAEVAWALLALAVVALAVLAHRLRAARAARGARGGAPPPPAEPGEGAEAKVTADRRREVFERMPRNAIVVDASARVAEINRLARASFPFLAPGMGLLEAFGNHVLAAGVAEALAAGEPTRFSVRLFAEGRHSFDVVVEPFEAGGAREALVVLIDTTEAVAYQELRSQFVANVSHELRTPLTGLRALLEALEDTETDPGTRARFAARARHEAERLEALVTDILFLSELEATEGLPSGAASDLAAAARAAAEELAGRAEERAVAVAVDAARPAWAPLTERMARTVVSNLLENAIRYAGPGSHACATVTTDGTQVIVEVSDDGAGIPERHLPHVFERFYRVDPSRSRELGGTGLGLSIVKHIAERVGGSVEARSREGFGTTVRVLLPSGPPPAEG
jgi:signal transduction histidine kinase